jgi:hypothetical protein
VEGLWLGGVRAARERAFPFSSRRLSTLKMREREKEKDKDKDKGTWKEKGKGVVAERGS